MSERREALSTFALQVLAPNGTQVAPWSWQFINDRLRETEENLSDLLPPGFSVVIREWDEADESWRSGLWRNTQ